MHGCSSLSLFPGFLTECSGHLAMKQNPDVVLQEAAPYPVWMSSCQLWLLCPTELSNTIPLQHHQGTQPTVFCCEHSFSSSVNTVCTSFWMVQTMKMHICNTQGTKDTVCSLTPVGTQPVCSCGWGTLSSLARRARVVSGAGVPEAGTSSSGDVA